jgi:quinol monooxygenase YgiN
MRSYARTIRKEKDCSNFGVCQDSENENYFTLIGEWDTRVAMNRHFKTQDFEVLIGAAKVLGETMTMNIAEVSKSGGFELAKEKIASHKDIGSRRIIP